MRNLFVLLVLLKWFLADIVPLWSASQFVFVAGAELKNGLLTKNFLILSQLVLCAERKIENISRLTSPQDLDVELPCKNPSLVTLWIYKEWACVFFSFVQYPGTVART